MPHDPGDEQTRLRRPADDTAVRAPRPDETALRRPQDETAPRRPPDVTLMRPGPTDRPTPTQPIARQQIPFGQGFRLRGRYELQELIGQGAMGQVWRAKDLLAEE